MPERLDDGILYVSIRFRIASHNCCCGCGREVVTSLSPSGWKLIYDGETVSLYPSIENWNFDCKSHYWITRNTVKWAEKWSDNKIRRARTGDAANGDEETPGGRSKDTPPDDHSVLPNPRKERRGVWATIRRLWSE
jgi:hypothetical protein